MNFKYMLKVDLPVYCIKHFSFIKNKSKKEYASWTYL